MANKGNALVYELDSTSRELRILKDHYYLMEKLMRDEVRHEFERTIQERDNTILRLKADFKHYRSEMKNTLIKSATELIDDNVEGL